MGYGRERWQGNGRYVREHPVRRACTLLLPGGSFGVVLRNDGDGELKPLAIDLFCGSFGWSAGWLELGGRVVGFDLEHEPYHGPVPQGADLVLQDVRTIDGAQFRDASLILASSPCQEFSYRAMPWKRAKALGPPLLGMELFAQAERIQREAIAAAGHFIPMVQENVRGAQKYVGRARWHYGSYYLWGDVPALMPITLRRTVMKAFRRSFGVLRLPTFHGSTRRAHGAEDLRGLCGDGAVGTQMLLWGEELRLSGVPRGGSPLPDDWHSTDPELSRRTPELEVTGREGVKVSSEGVRTSVVAHDLQHAIAAMRRSKTTAARGSTSRTTRPAGRQTIRRVAMVRME